MEIADISLYDIVIHALAGIGLGVVVVGWYYFIKDQYAIWEINTYQRLKKKFDW